MEHLPITVLVGYHLDQLQLLNRGDNMNTVKPIYSGHLRFLKKVSAKTRCPLYRVLDFLGKKKRPEIKMEDFFHTILVNRINKIYFKI